MGNENNQKFYFSTLMDKSVYVILLFSAFGHTFTTQFNKNWLQQFDRQDVEKNVGLDYGIHISDCRDSNSLRFEKD
jgi:hypothetical protein